MIKDFQQQVLDLKLNTNAKIKNFLKGKTIKILGGGGGHNYGAIGSTVKLDGDIRVNTSTISQGIRGGNSIYFHEFSVILEETIEDLNNRVKSLKKDKKEIDVEIKAAEAKIEFMKENSLEKYDEDEFKVFQTLRTLENSDMTTLSKAKAIAQLIRG